MSEKVLEVEALTKKYKNQRGIFNVSFDINEGDIFGFLGPNGAGKTTAMKAVTGLLHADSGCVRICGHDTQKDFEQAMRHVGCIIETADSCEFMSAHANLKMAARLYTDIGDTRIDEVLELVGLASYRHEKVANFSLGMKQRLGLASAILSRPRLVILDEPANGLDIEGTVAIRNTIMQLAAGEKTTFFISSHMVHDLELMCNRIGIINDGRMLMCGDIKELTTAQSLEEYYLRIVNSGRERAIS